MPVLASGQPAAGTAATRSIAGQPERCERWRRRRSGSSFGSAASLAAAAVAAYRRLASEPVGSLANVRTSQALDIWRFKCGAKYFAAAPIIGRRKCNTLRHFATSAGATAGREIESTRARIERQSCLLMHESKMRWPAWGRNTWSLLFRASRAAQLSIHLPVCISSIVRDAQSDWLLWLGPRPLRATNPLDRSTPAAACAIDIGKRAASGNYNKLSPAAHFSGPLTIFNKWGRRRKVGPAISSCRGAASCATCRRHRRGRTGGRACKRKSN